jgi:hypothetical protein
MIELALSEISCFNLLLLIVNGLGGFNGDERKGEVRVKGHWGKEMASSGSPYSAGDSPASQSSAFGAL